MQPAERAGPAHRTRRRARRRARTLRGALGVTLLGALLPGAGYVWTGRRLGYLLLVPAVAGCGVRRPVPDRPDTLVDLAVDPVRLRGVATLLAVAFVGVGVHGGHDLPDGAAAPPLSTGLVAGQRTRARLLPRRGPPRRPDDPDRHHPGHLVNRSSPPTRPPPSPRDVTEEDPWGGRERVNVLLLGGDGGVGRAGIRTDTVILLSMNTRTGRSVMFSLPRNMMNAQFPADSPLHEVYPTGFTGAGDPANWMLNAVYGQVPALYPGILGELRQRGRRRDQAGRRRQPGCPRRLLRAGQPPRLPADRRRDGRGDGQHQRAGRDQRQHRRGHPADRLPRARPRPAPRRVPRAVVRPRPLGLRRLRADASPAVHGRRAHRGRGPDHPDPALPGLAEAGKEIVRTDIPKTLLPAFVDLALKVKDHQVRSIAFVTSSRFFSGDPDFDWMQESVRRALAPAGPPPARLPPRASPTASPTTAPTASATSEPDPGAAVDVPDTCAYLPEG